MEGNPIDSVINPIAFETHLIAFETHLIGLEECPINLETLLSDAERNYCAFEMNPMAREAKAHGGDNLLYSVSGNE